MHMIRKMLAALSVIFLISLSLPVFAAGDLDLTQTTLGYSALAVFILAYLLVMSEEKIHLRKSKPVLVAAGIIWAMIGAAYVNEGLSAQSESAFRHTLLEFSELMLFLLVAMTYINAMEERRVFDALRSWMIRKGFSFTQLFWLTGILSFLISPVADNLTTALLMCAVVMKVGEGNARFINLACINIVVAANAGGAFSPFGDITTLMVWQAGMVKFQEFFTLLLPSIVNFGVPAVIMSLFIEKNKPQASDERIEMKRGAGVIIGLFLLTIASAVAAHSFLHLPPVLGMMTGLGYLQFFGFYLRLKHDKKIKKQLTIAEQEGDAEAVTRLGTLVPFDVFSRIARAEWDTLLFFYGVVMCVGGLGFMGYLGVMSEALYTQWTAMYANIFLGVVSAVIDNIPVMFAVLTMEPNMSHGDWLLITLTAGTGGSMLSIGSAAGVALMGQARGYYTFLGHLRWAPVILLGYAASILVHVWLNAHAFTVFN